MSAIAAAQHMSDAMNAMEHAVDTITVAPLLDERVLSTFCQAVQTYADGQGTGEKAATKLRKIKDHLGNLLNVASLCRFAVLGDQRSVTRVRDELQCIVVDFPETLLPPAQNTSIHDPDPRAQLAAAVDLFAGAAFVSAGNPDQLKRFVVGIVRGIEDAVAFPLAARG
jgi:hypothetical protein